MKFGLILCLALAVFVPRVIEARAVTSLDCHFLVSGGFYTCQIDGQSVPENENLQFLIGGRHLQGNNNNDVLWVQIFDSSIPFIIREIFTTFPNLMHLHISATGLKNLRSGDFTNARNLLSITITGANPLNTIPPNAFIGASNLSHLEVWRGQITTINEGAFNGLGNLSTLRLENNTIAELHPNVFSPLISLERLTLNENLLEFLDGKLLENNRRLIQFWARLNRIDAIGRTLFDNTQVGNLDMLANVCVGYWIISGEGPLSRWSLNDTLGRCFENAERILK